ncbi:MAG: sigma-70 family RNA polymerase sigma factor [Actinomycetota bacterium]|nr:sigma-70 family RNA polymerase sigma factor [Actinomycetota bacterium]
MTEQEFNDLFRSYLSETSRFIARRTKAEDVEDLAADLFALAWQKRDSIPKGLELPWLYKSARYLISNHNRKQQGRTSILATLQEPQSAPSAESIALADLELAEAWKGLSTKEKEILSLWAFEGLEPKQLAAALEKSENACAIALSRAKSKLTQLLNSENN